MPWTGVCLSCLSCNRNHCHHHWIQRHDKAANTHTCNPAPFSLHNQSTTASHYILTTKTAVRKTPACTGPMLAQGGGTYILSPSIPRVQLLVATPLCGTLHLTLVKNFWGRPDCSGWRQSHLSCGLRGRTRTLCPWGRVHVVRECVPLLV